MQDLFTATKEPDLSLIPSQGVGIADQVRNDGKNPSASLVPLKKGDSQNKSKSLFKVYYKGKGGKFSDKESARIVQIENENRIFKNNWFYWKRQATRLSEDYQTEHKRVLELEEKVKELEAKLRQYETENIQQQEVPVT